MVIHMRKKSFFAFKLIIWMIAVCLMVFLFLKRLEPSYLQETLSASSYSKTPLLCPGDTVTQSFQASHDILSTVEIALSYEDSIPDDTQVTISLFRGNTLLFSQPLRVKSCPNHTFFSLQADASGCEGEIFTLEIQNSSDAVGSASQAAFSLLSTDKEYLYLENTQDCLMNGQTLASRLLCRFTYQTGYSHYYEALTWSFWIFLAALLFTEALPRLQTLWQRNNYH